MPVRLDESGCFPLAVLAEKRAKEHLADVSLLRSSVEYALGDAAREVATLKRELDAVRGWIFFPCVHSLWFSGSSFGFLI